MDQVLKFLKEESADIMVFQEVNKSSDSSLASNFRTTNILAENFPAHQLAFDSGFKIHYLKEDLTVEQGNATLSRYTVKNHELVYFDSQYTHLDSPLPGNPPDYRIYPKYMQKTWLDLGDKELLVINLHGVWDFHGNDTSVRLRMSQTILEQAKEAEHVVIAGDSNVRYDTKTIRSLISYYPSVLESFPRSTFNLQHKTDPGYGSAAVDILLTSPNIKVIESSLPDLDVSDHLPIVSTLAI